MLGLSAKCKKYGDVRSCEGLILVGPVDWGCSFIVVIESLRERIEGHQNRGTEGKMMEEATHSGGTVVVEAQPRNLSGVALYLEP